MGYARVPYTEKKKRSDEEHLQDMKFLENNYYTLMPQYPEEAEQAEKDRLEQQLPHQHSIPIHQNLYAVAPWGRAGQSRLQDCHEFIE